MRSSGTGGGDGFGGDAELRALFERTYGPVKNRGFEAFQQSRKKAATLEQLYVTAFVRTIICSWTLQHHLLVGRAARHCRP